MKVYSGFEGIKKPEITGDWNAYEKAEQEYVDKVKAEAKKRGKGKYKGKEVSFPYADSYAQYVVLSGTELIHLDIGDGWHYPYIERLKLKDIKDKIEQQERIDSLFD